MIFSGVNIFSSPYAISIKYEVTRSPIPKRRKRYRVTRKEVPGCYQTPQGLIMHPDLYNEMLKTVRSSERANSVFNPPWAFPYGNPN